jgi:hypothetical protein
MMPPDIPNALDVLLSNAELPPEQAVNVDDLWRRGRRRRGVKVGAAGAVLVAVTVVGVVIATSPTNSSHRGAIAPSPTSPVFQTPNPTLCTAAAAQSRMQAFVAEFNAGDPNIVDDSIATQSRLQFVQAPDFVDPTPPTTLRDGLTGYFHQLYAQGDRLRFVSVTAGDIDSFGDRDIAYQLIHITPTGQQQPAGGTASIECYAGKVSALYLTW